MTILLFLVLLSVIVVIHEAGHLFAAKRFGVYCYEFSFGMGPLLWKKKTNETQYSIRALPIGGYVSMAGETDGDEAYPDVTVPTGRRLTEKPAWQRIIIMLAGVFMNFVLAWVIFSMYILQGGQIAISPKAVVAEVVAGSPAEQAGIEPGDMIVKIIKEDGSSIHPDTYSDIQSFTYGNQAPLTYVVSRDGEEISLSVIPEYNEEYERYMIGISGPEGEVKNVNLLNCWYYGAQEMASIARLLLSVVSSLFRGIGFNQLSGPVGIYQATETYASYGFWAFLFLIGELSLNVGIFNLLPLPVLDGGQVVLVLCETIIRRKLSEKVKSGIMIACWVLLIGIMLAATWNDVSRLIMN